MAPEHTGMVYRGGGGQRGQSSPPPRTGGVTGFGRTVDGSGAPCKAPGMCEEVARVNPGVWEQGIWHKGSRTTFGRGKGGGGERGG